MQQLYNWSKAEAQVIKAAWASDHGRAALNVIIQALGAIDADTYDDNPLRMAHIAGRRFVARSIIAAVKMPVDKLVREEPDESRNNRVATATERANAAAAGNPIGRRLVSAQQRLARRGGAA